MDFGIERIDGAVDGVLSPADSASIDSFSRASFPGTFVIQNIHSLVRSSTDVGISRAARVSSDGGARPASAAACDAPGQPAACLRRRTGPHRRRHAAPGLEGRTRAQRRPAPGLRSLQIARPPGGRTATACANTNQAIHRRLLALVQGVETGSSRDRHVTTEPSPNEPSRPSCPAAPDTSAGFRRSCRARCSPPRLRSLPPRPPPSPRSRRTGPSTAAPSRPSPSP